MLRMLIAWPLLYLEALDTILFAPAPPMKTMREYEDELLEERAREFLRLRDLVDGRWGSSHE